MDPAPDTQSTAQSQDVQPLPGRIGRYRILQRLGLDAVVSKALAKAPAARNAVDMRRAAPD
jgi:hypothetical protein